MTFSINEKIFIFYFGIFFPNTTVLIKISLLSLLEDLSSSLMDKHFEKLIKSHFQNSEKKNIR